MAEGSKNGVFIFNRFKLDSGNLMLYRNGEEVQIAPKIVKTLAVLVEGAGTIISKEDLIERIWEDSIVEEANLTQYLYLLRKVLGTMEDGRPYIETLRRRGYRFNGTVERLPADIPVEKFAAPAPMIGTVEREGNVLRVVDWRPAEAAIPPASQTQPETEPVAPSAPPRRSVYRQMAIAGAAAAVAAALVMPAVFFLPRFMSVEPIAESKGEMTVVRLTNGLTPLGVAISSDGKYFAYHEQDGSTAHFWLQQTGYTARVEVMPPTERNLGDKTFSPDGQFIYFTALNKGEAQAALYRVPTLGGNPTKILNDVGSPVSFSPDGREMVFSRYNDKTREAALVIAPSDGGSERVLVKGGGRETLGYPAWSPDGKQIAYGHWIFSGDDQGCEFKSVRPDGTELRTLIPGRLDGCTRGAWLSDGKRFAFIGTKPGDGARGFREQVYLYSTATGELRRLTLGGGNRHHLGSFGVTNDDQIIAVPYNRSAQIWAMDPNGETRTATQLTNGISDGRSGIAPMSDGRVAYLTWLGESHTVWIMNTDGSAQMQLFADPPFVEELRSSPDNRYFIFSAPSSKRAQIFRIDTSGDNLQQLSFRDANAIDSTVSPDGKYIVYAASFDEGDRHSFPLFRIPIDGGEPVRLTSRNCGTPHHSPDGRLISCVVDYDKEFMIVSANGEDVRSFPARARPMLNVGVRWTPDGKSLVYIVHEKDVSNLWLQPIDGGKPRQLTNFATGQIFNFAYSVDGTRLFLSRGAHQQNDVILMRHF